MKWCALRSSHVRCWKYFLLHNFFTRRRRPLPPSYFLLPPSKTLPTSRMILHFKDCFNMTKIRFQPVDLLPPACALPSAPSLLISTTKLRHKIPDTKNQPFITRKNLLTNRPFRLKKPKRYVCVLQRIFMHFIYISFAEWKQLGCMQSTFLGKESTISGKKSTVPGSASQPFSTKKTWCSL